MSVLDKIAAIDSAAVQMTSALQWNVCNKLSKKKSKESREIMSNFPLRTIYNTAWELLDQTERRYRTNPKSWNFGTVTYV